ncbi:hypothetical protein Hanom_Chr13g01186301 [Helianthus anomalus]
MNFNEVLMHCSMSAWYKFHFRVKSLTFFNRVKCHFSPCGLGYFISLVQMFHFSLVGPKRFHRYHFNPLG